MNDVAVQSATPRLAGFVGAVDRMFPALWIGFYLLLPTSGWAGEMFESWHDQRKFLGAVNALLLEGRAADIDANILGPAYIGAAAAIHQVTSLSVEDSLVALNRASYALSIVAALVLVRALVTRSVTRSPMVSLAAQFTLVAVVFAAGTWYWSDVPWSHFFAAFLAVAFYAARFAPGHGGIAKAVALGVLLALLGTTRSFELLALLLAWGIVALPLLLVRERTRIFRLQRVLAGATAFVVTTAVVYGATGKRSLFFLYGDNLDRQAAAVDEAEVAVTPTFAFALLPVKLVQLFVDPCYLSLCQISDYETGGGDGSNLALWSLPLAIQLPALLLLPLCVVGVGVLTLRALRRREFVNEDDSEWRPLAEMTIAATGLLVGYAASTLAGPSHLQYGFARDFLLPALLTSIVAVVLATRGLWVMLERRSSGRLSSDVVLASTAILAGVAVVSLVTVARSSGLPRVESQHVGAVTYTARCGGVGCGVAVAATKPDGTAIEIPEASTLTFGCGDNRARLTIFVADLHEPVRPDSSCRNPRLVAAWPTVMGLPPGGFELAAIGVRNL